ncbi:DNA polymerase III subunit delta' [Enterovirga aerilata]|uniref:DNA polymerase III subunit delta n=1 Tax=Enterovirga aerilata TaxID=2730920 RepID=A0A849I7T2_9HYPH|nr:DNA polymerase III subunit delta' [Enterovirga sp. DB1703]NNM72077.1 DNA polymerase III subunit delta' [Enterovirga sp. DB1703]
MAAEAAPGAGGLPHPRERRTLVGHVEAERSFAEAIASGRLHHAWLIGGAEGIGKATLAYRVARRLLASADEIRPGEGALAVDPAGRTARQIAAGAHPNLIVLDLETASADVERPPAKTIPVKTTRRALAFFGTTAANGGHRVMIVDSAEDLTVQSANALLKTIEEPPPRSTILVVAHAPQRVLPTIRSRCRKLNLSPLPQAQVLEILRSFGPDALAGGEGGPELVERAAERAEGSVGRALGLLDPKRQAVLDELASLLQALPDPPMLRVLSLAEKLADRRAEGTFELALDAVQLWAAERIRAGAELGPARLAPLAELCEKVADAARSVETYNLDRRPFVVSMFGDLAEVVRAAA